MSWYDRAKKRNAATRDSGRWRQVRDLDGRGPCFRTQDGTEVISFASNDYLGLAAHPEVIAAATEAAQRWGTGSGSARLIVGGRPVHSELERELAAWKSKERAVLFPTGFTANLGVLSVLGTGDVQICSDELNHASIVDGCRMSKATVRVYPHGDIAALDSLLADHQGPSLVVSDSVFSMDGDVAPVQELTEVCEKHGALLVLDEAHAVLGPELTPSSTVDRLRVGTLSKFLGSAGGYVACDAEFADLLINEARPYIFTTAGTPADAAAALVALRIFRSPEGEGLVAKLRSLVDIIRPGHPSPIIPILVGDEDDAVRLSGRLLEKGYLVPAIRPPSVPSGSSRLRVTLSAAHEVEDVTRLRDDLRELGVTVG